jgi:hypothetical protein
MIEPEVVVTIQDYHFTLGELEGFIARARAVDGMPQNAMVTVEERGTSKEWTLTTSTAYREKQ